MTTGKLLLRSVSKRLSTLLLLPLSAIAMEEHTRWEDAWVRSAPPGAAVAAAYGRLVNEGTQPLTITAVTSTLGAAAHMHDSVANGDQRRTVRADARTLAPGDALVFAPGGLHIMLMEFEQAPAKGAEIQLCALTQNNDAICTAAPVRRDAPGSAHSDSGHHH